MSADKLVVGFGKNEVADLRSGVYAIEWTEVDGVPEADALVGCSSSGGEEATV